MIKYTEVSNQTQANRELRKKEKDERKSNLGLKNRLLSIIHDHDYLVKFKDEYFGGYNIPLIPNERCGLWYMKPSEYTTTAYFKSTDGHNNEWDFSTRRLNFHLLPLLENSNSLGIVDSARSGKRIPDSLSKTIPIWCAILNKASFPRKSWNDLLALPPDISPTEKSGILAKLPFLLQKFQNLKLETVCLKRPLRPCWIYPGCRLKKTNLATLLAPDQEFQPLFLITVSIECRDGSLRYPHFTYIQGAADDHELWAHDFDYSMLWEHIDLFSDEKVSQDEINRRSQILAQKMHKISTNSVVPAQYGVLWNLDDVSRMTEHLYVGSLLRTPLKIPTCWNNDQFDLVMLFDEDVTLTKTDEADCHNFFKHVKVYPLTSGKKVSSRKLRILLPEIIEVITAVLYGRSDPRILLLCRTGDDISIGVLLTCLVSFYDEVWHLMPYPTGIHVDKKLIHKHLARIVETKRVQPSRATLNSVNYYLMSPTLHH